MKSYDRNYYDKWYRSRSAVITAELRERRVRHAVASAEFILNRPIRSVLDIGCGEGAWRPVLRRLRPALYYLGIDPSEYAVRRFGKRRNLRRAAFGDVGTLKLRRQFDLVVCADVVMYISDDELERGLDAIAALTQGMAYIEAYTTGDEMIADFEGWHHRSEREYRRLFRNAGLVPCGLHCYVASANHYLLGELERCST